MTIFKRKDTKFPTYYRHLSYLDNIYKCTRFKFFMPLRGKGSGRGLADPTTQIKKHPPSWFANIFAHFGENFAPLLQLLRMLFKF